MIQWRSNNYRSNSWAVAGCLLIVCAACLLAEDLPKILGDDGQGFPKAPAVAEGSLSEEAKQNLITLLASQRSDDVKKHFAALDQLAQSNDPRLAWVLSDLLRFTRDHRYSLKIVSAAEQLIGTDIDRSSPWKSLTNYLIAWDIPTFDLYLQAKRSIFVSIVPEWKPLMTDQGIVDWRHVSWGGVGIDDRPYDQTDQQINSIPAVDNPEVTSVSGAGWIRDDEPVFGVVVNGEARAYPRFIMEIREMVNDTLGGRDFAMPYCTLCGSAQVWFTDRVPEGVKRPVLRTSGLLVRSNKLMYDIESLSVFDTFIGIATTGPLYKKGVKLPGHTVVSTTWGNWKKAHPNTTVLARKEAMGRKSDLRRTRDAGGPIFPVGDVDPRLSVHDEVVGVVSSEGRAVAFVVADAKKRLLQGREVSHQGVVLRLNSGGLEAFNEKQEALVAHEAFWFGWSQFRPDTVLWKIAH